MLDISRQRPKELRVFGRQPTFDNMLSTGTSFQENIYSHDFSKIADLQSFSDSEGSVILSLFVTLPAKVLVLEIPHHALARFHRETILTYILLITIDALFFHFLLQFFLSVLTVLFKFTSLYIILIILCHSCF